MNTKPELDDVEGREFCRKQLTSICRHIQGVQEYGIILAERLVDVDEQDLARRLLQRCFCHDVSKFSGIEFDGLFSNSSDMLKLAVDQHRSCNDHHPEYFIGGISAMNDEQLCEMVCDICARSKEQGTDVRRWVRDVAMKKYAFTPQSKAYKKIKRYLDLVLSDQMTTINSDDTVVNKKKHKDVSNS